MKTAKRNLITMGKELRTLKKDLKNKFKNNDRNLYLSINEKLILKKEMARAFNIAYFFKKHKIEFDRNTYLEIISKRGLERKSKRDGKEYIKPNLTFIENYLEGFESWEIQEYIH